MRHPIPPVLLLAGALLGFAGCGDEDPTVAGARDTRAEQTSPSLDPDLDPDLTGVPPECAEQFPAAIDAPDLAELTRLAADFPPPPVPATLCVTEETSTHQAARYVTDAPPEEVLDAYEELLADEFFSRHEAGTVADVPSLLGTPDDVLTQITAHDGWFEIGVSLA